MAAMFGMILTILSSTSMNVAITDIKASFGASVNEIGWVVTGFMIANVIIMPMAGWFSDLFGVKKFFVGALVIFTVASVLSGIAWDLNTLIFFRFLQGIGAGAMPSVAMTIIWETFPPEERTAGMAIFGLGATVGPTLGPLIGGYFGEAFDWRMIFFINLPLGIIGIFLAMAFISDSIHSVKITKIDWGGIATLLIWIVCIQIVLQDGQREGWLSSDYILTLALIAALAFLAFIFIELKAERPVVDLKLYKIKDYLLGTIIMVLVGVALFGPMFLIPLYAGSTLGFNAWLIGLIMLPMGIAMAVGMIFIGRFGKKINPKAMVIFGILLVGLSFVGITNLAKETSFAYLALVQIPRGLGLAFLFIPLTNICLQALQPRDVGNGSALFNFTRTLGGSLGIAWLSSTLNAQAAAHYNHLSQELTPFNPEAVSALKGMEQMFMGKGFDSVTAHQQALTMLTGMAHGKAFLAAYNDVFVIAAVFMFFSLIPLFFISRRINPS